jgi:proton glutamate symport protein
MKWLSLLVLLALVVGILAGMGVRTAESDLLHSIADFLQGLGRLWLNALRMTVVPLIFALLVTAVASVSDAAASGRLAVRALVVFAVMLGAAMTYVALAAPALLALWPGDPAATAALTQAAGAQTVESPGTLSASDWLAQFVPSNPVRAAAEDAIPALVVFALAFGFAATRLAPDARERIVGFFRAVADIMVQIVRWVLWLAPVGVFGLALGLGQESGLAAAGALVRYVVIVSVLIAGVLPLALLFAVLWGRVGLPRFIAGAAPVWAMAASTQSSIACLPAMVERTRDHMGLDARASGLTLPLGVALFRMTSPVGNLAVAYFVADVMGMPLDVQHVAAGLLVAFVVSVGSVGLPGTISFIASIAPIAIAMGLPIELLGVLVAVEVIPDVFRTLGNVTGHMAAAAIVNRDVKPGEAMPIATAEALTDDARHGLPPGLPR